MDIFIMICLIALILIGIIGVILQMISPIWGVISVIIGPLIGAYAGVKLGFDKNDKHRQKLEEEKQLFFKNLLRHDARTSIELIEERTLNLIPIDAWNSVVNSGNIALFEAKAMDLSDTYFKIQIYNYEAKRVRDAIEEAHLHPTTINKDHASRLKKNFDEVTIPETLVYLKDLERWLTRIRGKLNGPLTTLTCKSEGESTPIDKNSYVIPPSSQEKTKEEN